MLVKQKAKYIQTLGQKKFRQQEGVFIAEGPKLVKELLEENKAAVKEIYALKDWIDENKKLLAKTEITEITAAELEKISQLSTSNKVLALVKQFETGKELAVRGKITLVLDCIQDPGNMGTIIRIADWFGVEQIVCSNDSADIYNPKVVQATMGSIARVKVFYSELKEWLAKQKDIRIYATMLEGQDVSTMKKLSEGIIIFGNESKGISDEILQLANVKITILRKRKAESLNAAVAAGIILSHIC
ncbi:MAG: RNA methyltransferase [Sphingobacteriales bacterium]|nr:RNA methyltransferase [Sphingobacteriales bacterium]